MAGIFNDGWPADFRFPLVGGRPFAWPPRQFAAFDPAMGRGYRIGNSVTIPAGAGFTQTNPPVCIANHGAPNVISRWKVTLQVQSPNANDPVLTGARLRFVVLAKMENDIIPRRCSVTIGDAQVIYAPGRALEVQAFNPMGYALVANYQLDEGTAGYVTWEDVEEFNALAAETALDIPPFCDNFEVYTPQGGIAPLLRGYSPTGVILVSETLAVPSSGTVRRVPGLEYTIAPSGGGPSRHVIRYVCAG